MSGGHSFDTLMAPGGPVTGPRSSAGGGEVPFWRGRDPTARIDGRPTHADLGRAPATPSCARRSTEAPPQAPTKRGEEGGSRRSSPHRCRRVLSGQPRQPSRVRSPGSTSSCAQRPPALGRTGVRGRGPGSMLPGHVARRRSTPKAVPFVVRHRGESGRRGGSLRPVGPGAGSPRVKTRARSERRASIPVTFCSRMVGTRIFAHGGATVSRRPLERRSVSYATRCAVGTIRDDRPTPGCWASYPVPTGLPAPMPPPQRCCPSLLQPATVRDLPGCAFAPCSESFESHRRVTAAACQRSKRQAEIDGRVETKRAPHGHEIRRGNHYSRVFTGRCGYGDHIGSVGSRDQEPRLALLTSGFSIPIRSCVASPEQGSRCEHVS